MKSNLPIILWLLILSFPLQAQDYVDVIKFSSNNAFLKNNQNESITNAYNQNLQVYYPIRISESFVVLTGFTVENTNIDLLDGNARENLLMTRLNLGVKHQHSKKISGTYLVLPKIASNFKQIGLQDLQIGGLALWDYQVSDLWNIKVGIYVSTENHGSTITPLLGAWFRSRNRKFYINAVLPIRMDINYNIIKGFSVGADFLTSVKSYDLSTDARGAYVHENSIRAGAYLSYGFKDNTFIIRVKGGYDTTRYGLYNSGDMVGGQILLFTLTEDTRNQINPRFTGGGYIGGDLIYRFDLTKEKK